MRHIFIDKFVFRLLHDLIVSHVSKWPFSLKKEFKIYLTSFIYILDKVKVVKYLLDIALISLLS